MQFWIDVVDFLLICCIRETKHATSTHIRLWIFNVEFYAKLFSVIPLTRALYSLPRSPGPQWCAGFRPPWQFLECALLNFSLKYALNYWTPTERARWNDNNARWTPFSQVSALRLFTARWCSTKRSEQRRTLRTAHWCFFAARWYRTERAERFRR